MDHVFTHVSLAFSALSLLSHTFDVISPSWAVLYSLDLIFQQFFHSLFAVSQLLFLFLGSLVYFTAYFMTSW